VDTLGPGDCLAELALLPAPPAPSKEVGRVGMGHRCGRTGVPAAEEQQGRNWSGEGKEGRSS
jgi:hypothetical protein